MPLPFFKRSPQEAAAPEAGSSMPSDEDGAVQAARTRARRRLIGAVVLLAAGIVGFPILFETQPRPLPADLPIQVSTPGTAVAASPPPVRAASKPLPPLPTPPADAGNEPAATPGTAASAAPSTETSPSTPQRTPVEEPAPVVAAKSEAPKPASAAAAKPAATPASNPPSDGAASRVAVVADKPKAVASAPSKAPSSPTAETRAADSAASTPKAARYVVQVGAFTDPAALRDARQRVEKLGFKSYTQVVETPAGARTRVRVGPFDTREEAERASTRLKGGGLPANLLTL